MIKLLSPHYFNSNSSIPRQDEERFSYMVAKSAGNSPNHSPEKLDKLREQKMDGLGRKTFSKYQSRSLSQTIRSKGAPSVSAAKEDTLTRQMLKEFEGHEPIKAINQFVKHLNQKIPKENKIRKHLKKVSGINPKF